MTERKCDDSCGHATAPPDCEPTLQREKLEPCWCRSGGPLSVKANIDHGDFGCRERGRYVYCSNCWAHGPTYNTDAEAVTGWNSLRSRAPVVAPEGEGDEHAPLRAAVEVAEAYRAARNGWRNVPTRHEVQAIIAKHVTPSPASSPVPAEQDALVDEVQHRMDQVVEAAVEWHQAGREGGEWFDAAERLSAAINSLLEFRSTPAATPAPVEQEQQQVQCADCLTWVDRDANHTCRQQVRHNQRSVRK